MTANATVVNKADSEGEHEVIELSNDQSRLAVGRYGASLRNWWIKMKDGEWIDVLVGENLPNGNNKGPYFNCVCGRVANRISNASFELNGKKYELTKNHGKHHLHGGTYGLSFVNWDFDSITNSSVSLKYSSKALQEGYPCNVLFEVVYTLSGSRVEIEYNGRVMENSDLQTPINLTLHSYFNLANMKEPTVLNHTVQTDCEYCVETDNQLIPTGKILPVKGTPMDFKKWKKLGKDISQLLSIPHKGYDHYFVLDPLKLTQAKDLKLLVTISTTDLQLCVYSTEPGFQMYTGNYLNNIPAKEQHNVKEYNENAGVAIETHCLPDAINVAPWKDFILFDRNKAYRQKTVYEIKLC